MQNENVKTPNKELAAVCGLFCSACSVYIGTQEDPEKLKFIAERMQCSTEEIKCDGCRAKRQSTYCKTCAISKCASEKGLDFCGECTDFPCELLSDFQKAMPHRIELWQNLTHIKEAGFEQWYMEMVEHYSCPDCGTINSTYDLACRNCGKTPSCKYVELHQDEIEKYFKEAINH